MVAEPYNVLSFSKIGMIFQNGTALQVENPDRRGADRGEALSGKQTSYEGERSKGMLLL